MTGIPVLRLDVANLDMWGRLIKSWATHLDYISQDYPYQPPRDYWVNTTWPNEAGKTPASETIPDTDASGAPQAWALPPMAPLAVPRSDGTQVELPGAVTLTRAEFQSRLAAAGVDVVTLPEQYTQVVIVQGNVNTMVLRLPPKDTLQGSEDDLLMGAIAYPFRPFYTAIYGTAPQNLPTDRSGIMQLHANRIGEYTLNNCN
jgi:hypothetical protein